MSSTTIRSLGYLRDNGWIACKVEQRLHMPQSPYPVTRDAFNFGDILAAHPERRITALIQTTTRGHIVNRARKILEDIEIAQNAAKWIEAGNRIYIHGWDKPANRWRLRMQRIVWHPQSRFLTAVEIEITRGR